MAGGKLLGISGIKKYDGEVLESIDLIDELKALRSELEQVKKALKEMENKLEEA